MEINICIDSLTDCLLCTETGVTHNTEFRHVKKTISSQDALRLKEHGWKFDWSIPHKKGYEVYELLIKGSSDIQGMIAIKHIRSQYYTHIDIVEAAPHNVGKQGKYKGVGAHLFAIACKLSWDAGHEGYVQFTAKSDLISHYQNTLMAKPIDWHNMYIDSYGALLLINKYFKGED